MSKAVRLELLADHRLTVHARLLGLLLSDHPSGLDPSEAVRVLGFGRSTVHRWAAELRARAWLRTGPLWSIIESPECETPTVPDLRRSESRIRDADSPGSETPRVPDLRLSSPGSGTGVSAIAPLARTVSEISDPRDSREESETKTSPKASESSGSDEVIPTELCVARAGASKKKLPPKVAQKISEDFTPTNSHRLLAQKHGLNLELERVAFVGHFDGRLVDSPNGRFSQWLANEVKYRSERQNRNGKPPGLVQAELNAADHRAIERAKRRAGAAERRERSTNE